MKSKNYLPLGDDGEFAADMRVPNSPVQSVDKPKPPKQAWPQLPENERVGVAIFVILLVTLIIVANPDKFTDSEEQVPRRTYPYPVTEYDPSGLYCQKILLNTGEYVWMNSSSKWNWEADGWGWVECLTSRWWLDE